MENVTLALALLLGSGFVIAKIGQMFRLPSVTGYICAGLLLGPAGLELITAASLGHKLDHFTDIALMLIAFGIGEHLELKRLRRSAKSITYIGLSETTAAFLTVGLGTFFAAKWGHLGDISWGPSDYIALSLLLGAISVATAPATTLHVMSELKAAGPLTSTLMAVVALNNGLAILFFGVAILTARHIAGASSGSMILTVAVTLLEIFGSLVLGLFTGQFIDYVIHSLRRRGEMLTMGLALLLLCGEVARLLHLSPLLAGMAAGFAIVNSDRRDVRLFRTFNLFEPPIYVLFFALAGAELDIPSLATVGWVGVAYFLCRAAGKMTGAGIGARLTDAPTAVRNYLGLALVPQAGVAIGFIFLVRGDADLAKYSELIIPIVLAGVILSELAGPAFTRFAVIKAGEATADQECEQEIVQSGGRKKNKATPGAADFKLVPWTWERLTPPSSPEGVVLFGAAHSATAAALGRVATLLANYYGALPLAVRVRLQGAEPGHPARPPEKDEENLFALERAEVESLGYDLKTSLIMAENVAAGILAAAHQHKTLGIVLGYPLEGTIQEFEKVIEAVAKDARCQTIVVRFSGILHIERILVPLTSSEDLKTVRHIVRGLSRVGSHRITLLRLMPSDVVEEELEEMQMRLHDWAKSENLSPYVRCQAVATEARLETIFAEACHHDLLVMASSPHRGLRRLFFGSLAEWVARESTRPLIMVHNPTDLLP